MEYWFTGGGESTDARHFEVVEDSDDADVLILAAEDRTGASTAPAYPSTSPATPNYLSFYEDALTANGIGYDVYDVDAMGRTAPDHLGVLGHYEAVIWYRGNDIHVREPGWPGGNVSRLAVDETLEVRQYLNEGGKLLYTGQWAGGTENGIGGNQLYDPVANQQCLGGAAPPPEVTARCLNWGDKNDFLQYYLGASLYVSDAGLDAGGNPFPIVGVDEPFAGPPASGWTLGGGTGADNQVHNASFLATSGLLDPASYPQFESWISAKWDRPGGPFAPHTGDFYVYSQIADITYKRLARTINVPAGGATMSFWTSYDTEADWDHVFVEAHTVGQDNWTTLPDLNGHTTQATGESCKRRTPAAGGPCTPISTTTRPRPAPRRVTPPGPPAPGTRRRGTPAAGNSGRWISAASPASRSRSPSPTQATGRPRVWESSSTTSRSRPVREPPPSRPGWTAGPSRAPRREAHRTRTTSPAPRRPASPKDPVPPPRTRSTSGSGSKASRMKPTETRSWTGRSTT